ncbi:auxin response factor 5-like [Cicer arietinum]|uniref:auxin response factor 5-like n=1 Tax=Cicer arietinum TaxID=3827 RepID=UPI003CC56675
MKIGYRINNFRGLSDVEFRVMACLCSKSQLVDGPTTSIPNDFKIPSQLLCQVKNLALHAHKETDEIYAEISLQPLDYKNGYFPISLIGLKATPTKHRFYKTLTASDISIHSSSLLVPQATAELLFPPLDYTVKPTTQELLVRDLHDNTWTFKHTHCGRPKRHVLSSGWNLFVRSKRLKVGDTVIFIRDEKSQLLVGIRRANRQQASSPDSMHSGVLAVVAQALANRSPWTVYYNPRVCTSEFVIPHAKYIKAKHLSQLSVGLRFGMMFETQEFCKHSDLDPLMWPGSKWRNIQVEWDD